MTNVLFVCLGNICRSPAAEGIFKKLIVDMGLDNRLAGDSAGTANYHVGEPPHPVTTKVAAEHEVVLDHQGQQFNATHFDLFDFIITMDRSNYRNVMSLARTDEQKAKIFMLRQWENGPEPMPVELAEDVPDPYYGGLDGFRNVHRIIEHNLHSLISYLIHDHN